VGQGQEAHTAGQGEGGPRDGKCSMIILEGAQPDVQAAGLRVCGGEGRWGEGEKKWGRVTKGKRSKGGMDCGTPSMAYMH
jgi:hypothetical protein